MCYDANMNKARALSRMAIERSKANIIKPGQAYEVPLGQFLNELVARGEDLEASIEMVYERLVDLTDELNELKDRTRQLELQFPSPDEGEELEEDVHGET